MENGIWLISAIAILMVVLFVIDKLRQDVVALIVLVLLGIFHLLTPTQLLSGFSSSAVISLVAVMIIGKGLEKAGLVSVLSSWALKTGRGKSNRIFLLLALICGVTAGFLRSLGAFALMMPIINRLSLYLNVPRSKLFLPLGFCAIVGGTLTLVGSGPLLVLNDLMSHVSLNAAKPINMFSVTPVGLSLLVVIILFFWFIGRKMIRGVEDDQQAYGVNASDFRRTYGYGGRFYELKVLPDSPIRGMNLSDLEGLIGDRHLAVVGLTTGRELNMPPLRRMHVSGSSRLAIVGKREEIEAFAQEYQLRLSSRLKTFADILNPMRSGFSEVVIPPGSSLIGTEMNELHMRRQHGVQVLAIFRGKGVLRGAEMRSLKLRSGDTLGLFSGWQALGNLQRQSEFAVVTTEFPREQYVPKKRFHALACFVVSMALVIFSPLPISVSLLIGALGMVLCKVVEMDEAYRSVSWKTVFLMAGLIPFGLAMQSSGAATLVAHGLIEVFGHFPQWVLLAGLCILAGGFSLIMTNVGATVVLVPIAMQVAVAVHADPRMFAIVTALATSNAFLLPTHQVNALITGAGSYRTSDFLKVGSVVSVIYLVVLLLAGYLFL